MKTIAVMTDFSDRANNAAKYALGLAQHLHANVLLYNSFVVPAAEPLGLQVAWSLESFNELQADSEKELHQLADHLRQDLSALPEGSFKPVIYCKCDNGTLSANLNALLSDREILLLVIGSHRKRASGFMLSNHMREMIDGVELPILIIPEKQQFRKIGKIAFATDLQDTDLNVLSSLSGFARPSYAQIMLTHICTGNVPAQISDQKIDNFLQEVGNKINYPNIFFRKVTEEHLKDGFKWLIENVTSDILVMVHRNKSFWDQLLNHSNTQKMAERINLPLLVYPCPAASLPVF